jgi:tetratricopeptide (TPR) repeat protein
MRAIKAAAAALICAAAVAAIYFTCLLPVRWNRAAREAWLRLERADVAASEYEAGVIAREVLEDTSAFAGPLTHDMRIHFHRAQAYSLVENHEAAIDHYQLALRLDQRPEIYAGLANSLARAGRRDQARRVALLAVRFRPQEIDDLDDGLLRAEVEAALKRKRTRCIAKSEAAAARTIGRD